MTYRDDSFMLRERNAELTADVERLKARVAELEQGLADDNSNAVMKRQLEVLREENARLRKDIQRLDPNHTTEEREAEEAQRELDEHTKKVRAGLATVLDAIVTPDRYRR